MSFGQSTTIIFTYDISVTLNVVHWNNAIKAMVWSITECLVLSQRYHFLIVFANRQPPWTLAHCLAKNMPPKRSHGNILFKPQIWAASFLGQSPYTEYGIFVHSQMNACISHCNKYGSQKHLQMICLFSISIFLNGCIDRFERSGLACVIVLFTQTRQQ